MIEYTSQRYPRDCDTSDSPILTSVLIFKKSVYIQLFPERIHSDLLFEKLFVILRHLGEVELNRLLQELISKFPEKKVAFFVVIYNAQKKVYSLQLKDESQLVINKGPKSFPSSSHPESRNGFLNAIKNALHAIIGAIFIPSGINLFKNCLC